MNSIQSIPTLARAALGALALSTSPLLGQSVRDSAGVRIVDNTRPALARELAWSLSPEPKLTIGGGTNFGVSIDSNYDFLRVNGIARLSDGRIVVANDGSLTVRFYDSQGHYLGFAGRKGQGPGEFQQLLRMAVIRGDTLAISDLNEVELYSGDGSFARRGAHRGEASGYLFPIAFLHDGSYVSLANNPPPGTAPPPPGRKVSSAPLVHVRADGARADTIALVPQAEQVFDGRSRYGTSVVFTPGARVTTDGERIYYGFPDRYEIRVYASTGRLVSLWHRAWEPRRVEESHKAAYRAYVLSTTGENGQPQSPQMRARSEQLLARRVYADALPAFSIIQADAEGNLWVRRYDPRELFVPPGPASTHTLTSPTDWDVFDTHGRWQCTVRMPARFTPLDIGRDYVAGLARDDDDVESVRVYRLVKP